VARGEAGGGPGRVAISARLRTTPADEHVLDLVAEQLGELRRADLAQVCHPLPLDPSLDDAGKRQARRHRRNTRKTALTAESSARWANAIIAANETRLAQPTVDTLTPEQRRTRRKAKLPKGYPTQAERFQKQRRLQVQRGELSRVTADRDNNRVHVTEGGKRLAASRRHLEAANLTLAQWRNKWDCARDRIERL
jgi:predicted transcriptional regulator